MGAACPEAYVDLAHRMGDAAGEIVKRYFRSGLAIDMKADDSPVTAADRESELAMRRLVEAEQSAHGIQGEEFDDRNPDAEWLWILDPIDGTRSFITGTPMFGTLIALTQRRRPVLGLLDQPVLRERWLAHGAAPTTLNGTAVRTRACAGLAEAVLFTTGPEYYQRDDWQHFERLWQAARFARFSADCYAFGLLACGFVDVVVEPVMHVHDYAALIPIVENAGGVITNWQGEALDCASTDGVVAAGDRRVHAQALAMLAGDA